MSLVVVVIVGQFVVMAIMAWLIKESIDGSRRIISDLLKEVSQLRAEIADLQSSGSIDTEYVSHDLSSPDK